MTDSDMHETAVVEETGATKKSEGANLFEMYETDLHKELGGVFLDFGKGTRVRVARAGPSNKKFTQIMESLTRPHRRQMDTDTLPADVGDRLLHEAFAKGVVLGWENVRDREGNKLPFTVENCIHMFEEIPEWFTQVREAATKFTNFRLHDIEADAGN